MVNEETLVIFGPVEEFHAFQKFNCFISEIKKNYSKIVAITFEKSVSIISEADEILYISNDFLEKNDANYPQILDIMTDRNISNAYELSISFINNLYPNSKILYYDFLKVRDINNNYPFAWYNVDSHGESFSRDVKLVRKWIQEGKTLKPSVKSFNRIKNTYGYFFDKITYIFITRNFQNKQPESNTQNRFPHTKDLMQFLVDKGHNVINIGFPPSDFEIKTEETKGNYHQLNFNHSHEDLLSLMMMSNGVFSFTSGLFVNVCAHANIFKLEIEFLTLWDDGETFTDTKKNNLDLVTLDFIDLFQNKDYVEIYNQIKDVSPPNPMFSNNNKNKIKII